MANATEAVISFGLKRPLYGAPVVVDQIMSCSEKGVRLARKTQVGHAFLGRNTARKGCSWTNFWANSVASTCDPGTASVMRAFIRTKNSAHKARVI
jgi:hypothetical protein